MLMLFLLLEKKTLSRNNNYCSKYWYSRIGHKQYIKELRISEEGNDGGGECWVKKAVRKVRSGRSTTGSGSTVNGEPLLTPGSLPSLVRGLLANATNEARPCPVRSPPSVGTFLSQR